MLSNKKEDKSSKRAAVVGAVARQFTAGKSALKVTRLPKCSAVSIYMTVKTGSNRRAGASAEIPSGQSRIHIVP